MQIAQTNGLISLLLGTRKGWQKQTGQDRDDRNDHQQLNESKSAGLLLEMQTAAGFPRSSGHNSLYLMNV